MESIKCDLCDVKCESRGSYLDHLETHEGVTLSCRMCHKSFRNKYLFLYHKESSMCELKNSDSQHLAVNNCQTKKKKKKSTISKKTKLSSLKQCSQCNTTFQFERHFIKHMEGHKRNNCIHCPALFTNRKDLRAHVVEEHKLRVPEATYECRFCNKKFTKRKFLFKHFNEHANGQWVCETCGCFFKTGEDHATHQEKYHENKQWICERCHEHFSRRQQYLVHMKEHGKHACRECGETFASKRRLGAHGAAAHRRRSAERRHPCAECGRRFARPQLLRMHLRLHTGEKPHECVECGKRYHTPRGYAQHLHSSAHQRAGKRLQEPREEEESCAAKGGGAEGGGTKGGGGAEGRVACPDCDLRFSSKHRLQRHALRLHRPSEALRCERCPRAFNCKENLKRHQATHSAERRFVCERCAAAFRSLHALKDHLAYVHSAARDFPCGVCGAAFKRNSGLTRHMATHSEARPHACAACGLSYKRAAHLRRHRLRAHAAPAASSAAAPAHADPQGDGAAASVAEAECEAAGSHSPPPLPVPCPAPSEAVEDHGFRELCVGDAIMEELVVAGAEAATGGGGGILHAVVATGAPSPAVLALALDPLLEDAGGDALFAQGGAGGGGGGGGDATLGSTLLRALPLPLRPPPPFGDAGEADAVFQALPASEALLSMHSHMDTLTNTLSISVSDCEALLSAHAGPSHASPPMILAQEADESIGLDGANTIAIMPDYLPSFSFLNV